MPTPPPPLDLTDDGSLDPIRYDGDVRFVGTVRRGRTVEVGGHLTVDGDVDADRFAVGRSMTVTGHVRGGKACTVGGDLRCRAIEDTNVVVRGDVVVRERIASSRVACAGRVEVPDGVIVGSDVSANGGVACHTLGDEQGTPTEIEAGVGRVLRLLETSIAKQIDERRSREDVMRASIEPLMANMKALTPAQREKVTEMLFQADELGEETKKLVAAFERRRQRTIEQARPRVAVATMIRPGVSVSLETLTFTARSALDGPLTLTSRSNAGAAEIVSVRTADGVAEVLPARPLATAA